ncbi:MAG: exosortase/archaeosortase family protein [Paludibacter sp.]|nr:exosortase/archaeosortase family protein [Paludibacter sp.]
MKLPNLKLPEELEPYRAVILFAVILMLSNFFWKYDVIGDESESINSTITFWGFDITPPFTMMAHHVAHVTESVLNFLGSSVSLLPNNSLRHANGNSVLIIWACTGLKQAYIFFCIIAFNRGPWIKKLWYVPFGLVVVYLFNIFRICTITACIEYHPHWFNFLHLYFFKYLYYLVIFGMWVFWEERIIGKRINV